MFALSCLAFAGDTKDADDVYTIHGPERTLEAVEATYAEMSPVGYEPPKDRWERLPRTAEILRKGDGELRVVMLGDSIVNDTSRSAWEVLVMKAVPGVTVTKVTSVRGSTGCWWYREPGRVKKYVLDHRPDLVIIGGISHRDDVEAVREVVRQIWEGAQVDVLLMSPAFGTVDPKDDAWWMESFSSRGLFDPRPFPFHDRLHNLANTEHIGYLDMTRAWAEYVRRSGKEVDWFKRDVVHANERGEQVLGRVLTAYLTPEAR